jgi:TonB-dependent receptor
MNSRYPAPTAAKAASTPFRLSARTRARFAAALALAASASSLWADGRVTGRVTAAATQSGLPGAEITVAGSSARAVTAADGSFTLSLPAGKYELTSYYLGYPSQTLTLTVTDETTTPARFALGATDDVVTLESFTVEGTREGQARALNQQRTSTNLTSIISSDLSGQFPDKTIADAVKRLPGVTVETDTDTGGSEGRYITIRGMNADFNAVSINGVRASVSDFSGLSRRVPLDVVSAKSADQIEVTKALRPDQDGDGIGGAVNIVTRSPFDRDGMYATAEASLGYSAMSDDYTSSYPYNDPNTEFSAAFSTQLGKDAKHGISISANRRDRAFLKQRVSTTGWRTDPTTGAYRPLGIALQHFYDDVEATGVNGTYEWRPTADAKLRFDASFSNRDTERGRDRQVINYGTPDAAGAVIEGDTFTQFTSSSGTSGVTRRVERNVRQFFETQTILNTGLSGDIKHGDWTFTPLLGLNQGNFDGDPKKDVSARFRSSRGTLTYTADGYTPRFTTTSPRNDPTDYFLNSLDRGTSSVAETTYTAGLDAKRDATLFDGDGYWKFGVKTSMFERDYKKVENFFFRNTIASPDFFADQALADYRANSTLNGTYDYGFFIDPNQVRDFANSGGLDNPAVDNALRSRVGSYDADEDIHAGFAMGQFTWGKLTALSGARVELSRVNFTGADGVTNGVGDIIGVTPYDQSNDYVDVLPGLHLRYEQTKALQYRFAVTRSLARPRLADLNPSRLVDNNLEEITQGNIKLDPTRSTNLDLGAEYYFSDAGTVSFGLFYKDMTDNIYTTRSFIAGGPQDGYSSIARANAKSAQVRGFELGYDQQFTFLPAPLDGFGAFVNYTYADSEVDTGLAQFAGVDLPLFNQVENTLNVGLFYEKKGFRSRISLLYRSESLIELSTDATTLDYDAKLSRYLAPTTTLDVTASYEFYKNWEVFTQFSNLLSEPGKAYDGTGARMDYNEVTDWSASLGFRWSL